MQKTITEVLRGIRDLLRLYETKSVVSTETVASSTGKTSYTITLTKDGKAIMCTCPGWKYRNTCKHLPVAEAQAAARVPDDTVTPEQREIMLAAANDMREIVRGSDRMLDEIEVIVQAAQKAATTQKDWRTTRKHIAKLQQHADILMKLRDKLAPRMDAWGKAWRGLLKQWKIPYNYPRNKYRPQDIDTEPSQQLLRALPAQSRGLRTSMNTMLERGAGLQALLRKGAETGRVDKRRVYNDGMVYLREHESAWHGRVYGVLRKTLLLLKRAADYERYEALLARLEDLTQQRVGGLPSQRVGAVAEPITDYTTHLAGLHREVWDGVDTDAYLQQERDAWKD